MVIHYGWSTAEEKVDCTDEECYRLFLNGVEILGNYENLTYRSFEYNIDEYLPPRTSNYVDHWGYFKWDPSYSNNLHPVHSSGIPELSSFQGIYNTVSLAGTNKDAVLNPGTKWHTLEKIVYPTGGYTEFIYEQNHTTHYVGGLRIHEIIDYDNVLGMERNRRTFHYSNGVSYRAPVYHYSYSDTDENVPTALAWVNDIFYDPECAIEFLVRYSKSLVTLYDINGSHIGYPNVTVESADGGKIVYNFTNFNSNPDEPPVTYTVVPQMSFNYTNDPDGIPFSSYGFRGWERGLLDDVTIFNNNGKKVKKVDNVYTFFQSVGEVIKGLKLMSNVLVEYFDPDDGKVFRPKYHAGTYSIYPSPFFLDYTVTDIFDQKDPLNTKKLTTKIDYEYDPEHLQVKEIATSDSEGNLITTKFTFPADFEYTQDVGSVDPVIIQMKNKHIISPVVEQQVWVNDNGTNKLISADLTRYRVDGGDFLMDQLLTFRSNNGVASFSGVSLDTEGEFTYDGRYITETTFNEYDGYNNLLKQTARDGTVTNYEWDDSHSLIAATTVNAGTPYAMRTEYVHSPLIGLSFTTDPNGFITSYEYDAFNRLKLIRDNEDNIIKKFDYYYYQAAKWEDTGSIRCQQDNEGFNTGFQEKEQKDTNPYSESYNTLRWISVNLNESACPVVGGSITLSISNITEEAFSLELNGSYTGIFYETYNGNFTSEKATDIVLYSDTYHENYFYSMKVNGVPHSSGDVTAGGLVELLNLSLFEGDQVDIKLMKNSDQDNPNWTDTGSRRCVTDSEGNNTGEQERLLRDINPFSDSYNNTTWVSAGDNLNACPIGIDGVVNISVANETVGRMEVALLSWNISIITTAWETKTIETEESGSTDIRISDISNSSLYRYIIRKNGILVEYGETLGDKYIYNVSVSHGDLLEITLDLNTSGGSQNMQIISGDTENKVDSTEAIHIK